MPKNLDVRSFFLFAFCIVISACSDTENQEKPALDPALRKKLSTTATIERNPLNKNEQVNPEGQVAFEVSSDKIEGFVNDTQLGVSFAPPRGFAPINYAVFTPSEISAKWTKCNTNLMTAEPVYAFRGQANMVVSKIDFTKSKIVYKDFLSRYEILVRERFAPANVIATTFMKGDIQMTQFFIQEAEQGLFRVVFSSQEANKALQFDYSIKRQTVRDDMQAIEPSLGTITMIPLAKR
jgi:hypothetical protein